MGSRIVRPFIAGYAIVSEDGMIAEGDGAMPDALKIEADQRFFEHGLDDCDVVVHGKNSHEGQPHSHLRHRLIVSRRVRALELDPSQILAWLWNPAVISFEDALNALEMPEARVGVLGGTEVFAMFLDRYDVFHLSRAHGVRLPGGRPVFPGVPARTPEQVLASHAMKRGPVVLADNEVDIVMWCRA